MSQMILFTYKKPNNLFFGIENNLYFKEYAKVLFHTNCTDGIYTIPNFDSLCVCAQKSIGNGISINQTELFKVLQPMGSATRSSGICSPVSALKPERKKSAYLQ